MVDVAVRISNVIAMVIGYWFEFAVAVCLIAVPARIRRRRRGR